jgi:predicted permease
MWKSLRSFLITLNEFMTVPLWAAFLSLVVALIPPLQHAIDAHVKPIKGALEAAGACSIPVTLVVLGAYFYTPEEKKDGSGSSTVATAGGTPNMMDRPGAAVNVRRSSWIGSVKSMFSMRTVRGKGKAYEQLEDDGSVDVKSKPKARPGETRTVVIAVVSRMLLTPLLLLPMMALSAKYDIPSVFDE